MDSLPVELNLYICDFLLKEDIISLALSSQRLMYSLRYIIKFENLEETVIKYCRETNFTVITYIYLTDPEAFLDIIQRNPWPLYYSIRVKSLELIDLLLKHNCKKNIKSMWLSCTDGNLKLVKILQESKVFPSNSCLNEACKSGNLDLIKYLYTSGNLFSKNSVKYAVIYNHFDIVKYLIEVAQVPINHAIPNTAYTHQRINILNYLLDKGYNISKKIKFS